MFDDHEVELLGRKCGHRFFGEHKAFGFVDFNPPAVSNEFAWGVNQEAKRNLVCKSLLNDLPSTTVAWTLPNRRWNTQHMEGSVDNGRLGGWGVGEVKYLKKLRADNAYNLTRLPKNILSVLAVSGVDINVVLTAQMLEQLLLDRRRLKG